MNKEQLKPCPFCGGSAKWADRACNIARVKCTACGASVYGPESRNYDAASSSAIAAWNRRSSDEQAEVVGWAYERLTHLMIAGEDRWIKHLSETEPRPSDNIRNVRRLYASPPAVAAGGVTEERLEAGAKALCLATGLDWDSIPETAEGDDKDTGPETRRYFRQWFKPALTAALAVGDEGIREGWQDIETAPKDGTEVLLWGVCWRDHQAYAPDRNVGWWAADGLGWQTRAKDEDIDPTHWQPLPTPPSRGEGV